MAHLNFEWDASPSAGVDSYNLYENGELIVPDIGVLNFSLLMDGKPEGSYDYYVTAVDADRGLESAPSNTVTADFFVPAAPTNLAVSWSA